MSAGAKRRSRTTGACFTALLAAAGLAACATRESAPQAYAPATVDAARSGIQIVGTGTDAKLDQLVTSFMLAAHVPNAELAVSKDGSMSFSHAYTYTGFAASATATTTIMRLASNSKAWTSAALYNLIAAGKVNPRTKVFAYLGITRPLPAGSHVDPRVYDISIEDMIQHESGWDDSIPPYYDPAFRMRDTAIALGLKRPIDKVEYVRYQLHQPLQEQPGKHYAYCNFCYDVLGMVVEKASGTTYPAYIKQSVAAPLGLDNVVNSPTVGARLANEVAHYYGDYTGLSAVYITSTKPWPYAYGGDGDDLQVSQASGGMATNAESMLALMSKYIIWGVGTPAPRGYDWAREGEMPGTNTWAEQLPNATNYSMLVNTNQYLYGSNPNAFTNLQQQLERYLDPAMRRE